jgi:uncharacterized coiled-coil DUF342 family protein
VQQWNKTMSALRRHLRGWASHTDGIYKQQKSSLQNTINELDIAAETRALTESEHDDLIHAREQLTKLLREEEIKYYQRAKVTDTLLGDNNTRYFQMVANGKHWKKGYFP